MADAVLGHEAAEGVGPSDPPAGSEQPPGGVGEEGEPLPAKPLSQASGVENGDRHDARQLVAAAGQKLGEGQDVWRPAVSGGEQKTQRPIAQAASSPRRRPSAISASQWNLAAQFG